MARPSPACKDGTAGDPQRQPRTLILCFDGTANQYDGDNTNVVKFYSLLKKDDESNQQLCYYQPGVGTYFNPGVVSPLFQWCAKILDEAFACYLDAHVRGGYQFIMQNYICGDKICMFGFSRGAYTARALAGMLHKIRLLPRDNPEQIPFAYKLYKSTDANNTALAAGFKQTFCRDVQIEFVGVWETIASVGVIMSPSLPFTTANTTIKTFRHALSLDEHRVKFQPNLYHWGDAERGSGNKSSDKTKISVSLSDSPARAKEKLNGRPNARTRSLRSFLSRWPPKQPQNRAPASLSMSQKAAEVDLEAVVATKSGVSASSDNAESSSSMSSGLGDQIDGGTDVLEVWFAGCHSDIGGGSVSDSTKLSLSEVTLCWMVREVVLAKAPIAFDPVAIQRANLPGSIFEEAEAKTVEDVNLPGQLDPSTSNPNKTQDPGPQAPTGPTEGGGGDPLDVAVDALQPLHDQLKIDPAWWLLEIIPLTHTVRDTNGRTQTKWWIHLGRGRDLPNKPKFHVTVKERMEDADLKYTPRAKWTAGTEIYVE
ncbi:hypothetical protein GSI_15141 [Ganoderma sinense ZZ0214-1]|uniref:T6SS Phospholipase effector Tle1-like catalytic domain-containing protein n=1 Tax=Ganoderma sinense ZZ0214-1 TaxID=1077348 RepID=A0A2G8RLR7_9APHY|nr:hypothetical protein GSI_15141 [Ganoderma sinense ZZ0214-1]